MRRPTGRPPSEGGSMNPFMGLADGPVLGIRDTGLPAINAENVITFFLYGVRFQNKVGASPAIRSVSERNTAVTRGNMKPAMEYWRVGLPHPPSGHQPNERATPENLTLEEGRSSCVMDESAAREAAISDGQFRDSYVWFLTRNFSYIGYYPLYVARLTTHGPGAAN